VQDGDGRHRVQDLAPADHLDHPLEREDRDLQVLGGVELIRGGEPQVVGGEQRRSLGHHALGGIDRRQVIQASGDPADLLGQLALRRLLGRLAGPVAARRHLPGRLAGHVAPLPDQHHVVLVDEGQHADARVGRDHPVEPLVAVREAHHVLPDGDPRVPVDLPTIETDDGRGGCQLLGPWQAARVRRPVRPGVDLLFARAARRGHRPMMAPGHRRAPGVHRPVRRI
jgi:hypothetical protein